MKKKLLLLALAGISLSSCGQINQTMQSLECNRQAVDLSTQVIYENIYSIQQANMSIQENQRQLEQINNTLKKASES